MPLQLPQRGTTSSQASGKGDVGIIKWNDTSKGRFEPRLKGTDNASSYLPDPHDEKYFKQDHSWDKERLKRVAKKTFDIYEELYKSEADIRQVRPEWSIEQLTKCRALHKKLKELAQSSYAANRFAVIKIQQRPKKILTFIKDEEYHQWQSDWLKIRYDESVKTIQEIDIKLAKLKEDKLQTVQALSRMTNGNNTQKQRAQQQQQQQHHRTPQHNHQSQSQSQYQQERYTSSARGGVSSNTATDRAHGQNHGQSHGQSRGQPYKPAPIRLSSTRDVVMPGTFPISP